MQNLFAAIADAKKPGPEKDDDVDVGDDNADELMDIDEPEEASPQSSPANGNKAAYVKEFVNFKLGRCVPLGYRRREQIL